VGRRLFTFLSALSLLSLVAVVALWVRSYWVADHLVWYPVNAKDNSVVDDYLVVSEFGVVYARFIPAYDTLIGYPRSPTSHFSSAADKENLPFAFEDGVWRRMGFGYTSIVGWSERPGYWLSAPHGALAVVFGVLPCSWLWRWLRRRKRAGLQTCPGCGYDLRASPHKCPECGTSRAPLPPAKN
jgi:hypothetical protein